jgi:hypothetical protein
VDSQEREKLEQDLSAFLDGELPDERVAELQRFLAESPDAKRLLAELEKTVAAVRSLPRRQSPDDLYESITAQLERSVLLDAAGPPQKLTKDSAVRWGRAVRITASAAVVLLAVGIGYMTIARSGKPKGMTAEQEADEPQFAMIDRDKSGVSGDSGNFATDQSLGRPMRGRGQEQDQAPVAMGVHKGVARSVGDRLLAHRERMRAFVEERASEAPPPSDRVVAMSPAAGEGLSCEAVLEGADAVARDVVNGLREPFKPKLAASEPADDERPAGRLPLYAGQAGVPYDADAQPIGTKDEADTVTVKLGATSPRAVWRCWAGLTGFLAGEGITLAEAPAAGQPGVCTFVASDRQLQRLTSQLAAVEGVRVEIEPGDPSRGHGGMIVPMRFFRTAPKSQEATGAAEWHFGDFVTERTDRESINVVVVMSGSRPATSPAAKAP